jgi:prefoldin subunit 5
MRSTTEKKIERIRWRINALYKKKWKIEAQIQRATKKMSEMQEIWSRQP